MSNVDEASLTTSTAVQVVPSQVWAARTLTTKSSAGAPVRGGVRVPLHRLKQNKRFARSKHGLTRQDKQEIENIINTRVEAQVTAQVAALVKKIEYKLFAQLSAQLSAKLTAGLNAGITAGIAAGTQELVKRMEEQDKTIVKLRNRADTLSRCIVELQQVQHEQTRSFPNAVGHTPMSFPWQEEESAEDGDWPKWLDPCSLESEQ
jgi:tetrahydromethanopterin S-methyltransferase subunit F